MDIEKEIDKYVNIYDELAYIKDQTLICILCAEDHEKIFPIFPSLKFTEDQFCSRCQSRLPVSLINWECDDCGTWSSNETEFCEGCSNKRTHW
jgi:hypothetical protein